MSNIKFVTAFYDIGRSEWQSYKRSTSGYIQRFHKMVNRLENDFVLWTSADLAEKVKGGIKKDNVDIKVFDFKEKYAANIEICRAIQNSTEFKKICSEAKRKQCPEYYSPEYAALMNAKYDFVQRSIESGLIETPFTGWIDFGYAFEEGHFWGKNKYECNWNDNRIRLFQRLKFDPKKVSIEACMLTNNCIFSGGAVVGKKESFNTFLNLYYRLRKTYWDRNIIDDDQGMLLACAVARPDLFECIFTNKEWRYLLNTGA
jgi:protein YibB